MGLCTWPPDATTAVVENARQNLKKTAPIVTKFIDALDRQKLIRFVALLLAAAGPKVIVQERRAVVGGAAATEEFHPGSEIRSPPIRSPCCTRPSSEITEIHPL